MANSTVKGRCHRNPFPRTILVVDVIQNLFFRSLPAELLELSRNHKITPRSVSS